MSFAAIQEVFEVNPYLVVILLAVGFILKHFIKDVNNQIIPIVLMILGVVVAMLIAFPYTGSEAILKGAVCGICSSAVAIGLHQTGKHLLFLTGGTVELNTDEDDEKTE